MHQLSTTLHRGTSPTKMSPFGQRAKIRLLSSRFSRLETPLSRPTRNRGTANFTLHQQRPEADGGQASFPALRINEQTTVNAMPGRSVYPCRLSFSRHSFNAITPRVRNFAHNYAARVHTPSAHICTRIYLQIHARQRDRSVPACCDSRGRS